MASSQSAGTFCGASQSQLALALAIVKSKPSHITVKDHILSIRRNICNGRNHHAPEMPEKYLDSITFWREAYEKSESAQSKLLDKVYELEQQNASLLAKGRGNTLLGFEESMAKRRVNGNGDSTVSNHSLKRAKTAKNSRSNTSRAQDKQFLSGSADELGYSDSATTPLLRHFHALQKQLQKKTDPDALVSTSVALCETVDLSIRSRIGERNARTMNLGKRKTLQPRDPDLQHILKGLSPCYPFLVQALNKVSEKDPTSSGIGVITYHVVNLFYRVLSHSHQYILSKAKDNIAQEKSVGKKVKQGSKTRLTKSTASTSTQPPSDEEITLKLFSNFLTGMILSLNPVRPEENCLLEGFLFSLLEHVGKMLSLFVFKELYSNPDLRLNSAKLPVPGNFDKGYAARGEMAVAQRAAESEAKHLIWILERAIAFTDQFERPSDETNTHSVSTEATIPQGMLERARTKLQNTLLKGIFGEKEQEFRDSLKMPEKPAYSPGERSISRQTHVSVEKEPAEWFTQEVWRLVGWDVLLKEKEY
ncbi:hypothetical protein PABG_04992 [Paracoccidioides brasiliensis Pb03]|nr:hypothetical protein PABG_04992 [Paracoccidioides brasiliensis Pb03]